MSEQTHEIQGADLEVKEDQLDMPIEVDKANEKLKMEKYKLIAALVFFIFSVPVFFIWKGTSCDPYSSRAKIDLLYAFTVSLPGLATTLGFSISAIKTMRKIPSQVRMRRNLMMFAVIGIILSIVLLCFNTFIGVDNAICVSHDKRY